MKISTRPSILFWMTTGAIVLCIMTVAFVPGLFVGVTLGGPGQPAMIGGVIAMMAVPLALWPMIRRQVREASWSVDLDGLESPAVGRVSFSEVVAAHRGYPGAASLPMKAFGALLIGGARQVAFDNTLVLKLANGALLPLNLTAPTLVNGIQVTNKLIELLAGKPHGREAFSDEEIRALRSRPANKLVRPKAA